MKEPTFNSWLQATESGWKSWQELLGKLALDQQPAPGHWKQAVKASLDSHQRLSEWQQGHQEKWRQAWEKQADTPSMLVFLQQCGDIWQQFGKGMLDWQWQALTTCQQQQLTLLGRLCQARGSGDELLALNALQVEGKQQWAALQEEIMPLLSGLSPALLGCVQQWLAPPAKPESTAKADSGKA